MKGWRSLGNKLTYDTLKSFEDITPEPIVELEEIPLIIEPTIEESYEKETLEPEKNDETPNDDSDNDDGEDNSVKPVQINLF